MSTARLSRAEQREATRERVLDAARAAFARDGFHAASTDAICRAAGFTRGALYASWRTKEELFLAVFDQEAATRFAHLMEHGGDLSAALDVAAAHEALLHADDGWSAALVEFTLHASRRPAVAAELAQRTAALRTLMADQLVARGVDRRRAARVIDVWLALGSGITVERLANDGAFPAGVLPEVIGALLG